MTWRFWDRSNKTCESGCVSIEPLLSLYSDGMASPVERRRVEAHMEECADCRQALRWMQATHQAIAARPPVSPPMDLRARIALAIAEAEAVKAPAVRVAARHARRPITLRPVFAYGLSVAVVAAVTGGVIWKANQPVHVATRGFVAPPVNRFPVSAIPRHLSNKSAVTPLVRPPMVAEKTTPTDHSAFGERHPAVARRPTVKVPSDMKHMAAIPQDTYVFKSPGSMAPSASHVKRSPVLTVPPMKAIQPQPTSEMPHMASRTPHVKVTTPQPMAPVLPEPPPNRMVATATTVPSAHDSLPNPPHQIRPSDIHIGPSVIHTDTPPLHEASAMQNLGGLVHHMRQHEAILTGGYRLNSNVFGASFDGPSDHSGIVPITMSGIR